MVLYCEFNHEDWAEDTQLIDNSFFDFNGFHFKRKEQLPNHAGAAGAGEGGKGADQQNGALWRTILAGNFPLRVSHVYNATCHFISPPHHGSFRSHLYKLPMSGKMCSSFTFEPNNTRNSN